MIPILKVSPSAMVSRRRHIERTKRVPEDKSKVVILLPLLAQLQESTLASLRVEKVDHKAVDLGLIIEATLDTQSTGEENALMRGRVREGREVGGGVGIGLDTALVRVVLQIRMVVEVRHRFWGNQAGLGV